MCHHSGRTKSAIPGKYRMIFRGKSTQAAQSRQFPADVVKSVVNRQDVSTLAAQSQQFPVDVVENSVVNRRGVSTLAALSRQFPVDVVENAVVNRQDGSFWRHRIDNSRHIS